MKASAEIMAAAHVLVAHVSPNKKELSWEGFLDPFSCYGKGLPDNMKDLLDLMSSEDRSGFQSAFINGLNAEGSFKLRTFPEWNFRYFLSSSEKDEIFLHCAKYSVQELKRLESAQVLNVQLELALSESHHRVKNTLQNVISYINITSAGKTSISKEETQKIIRHVHALTSLHDILLGAVKNHGTGKIVRLDKILSDVLSINSQSKSISWDQIPELVTSTRRAATTALILNELLDHASKFCQETVLVSINLVSAESASLCVSYPVSSTTPKIESDSLSNGLKLAELLAKSDLKSALEIKSDEKSFSASVTCPLEVAPQT